MEPPRTTTETAGREVPHLRLGSDADLQSLYSYGRKLGQGSFGVVYEATHIQTGTRWAIKEVRRPEPGSSKVKLLEQEIKILKRVNHPHIIHLKEVYETARKIYLVTELCVGGELRQLLQRRRLFGEDETRQIISSLADAIVYLHNRDIVHRDLKLENILVKNLLNDDDKSRINIKVTDFGLAVKTGGVGIENMMRDACGTLTYMAPEMMSGRGYSHLCDVWSVGVIMYTLLCGEPPFVSKTKTSLLEVILKEEVKYEQQIWTSVSGSAKDLLSSLLKVDPGYRMSANQLLENPWITGNVNGPALPSNVLEMMHHYLEQEENSQNQKEASVTEDKPPHADAINKCQRETRIFPAKMNDLLGSELESSERNRPAGIRNGSHAPTLPHTTTVQSHNGVKLCRLSTANMLQPQDQKDTQTSYLSPADQHRPPRNKTGSS